MSDLAPRLVELLTLVGPWIVLLLAFLETVFITGVVMPTGPAVIVTSALAWDGHLDLPVVLAAACTGALVGDSSGFWIGRTVGPRVLEGDSYVARAARRVLPRASALAGRHPAWGVSVARCVSFVRTLTPQLAGMSKLTYPRYLAYDLPGVAGWAAIYVGIGILAGESWRVVSRWVGIGWGVAFLLAALLGWVAHRRRQLTEAAAPTSLERLAYRVDPHDDGRGGAAPGPEAEP